MTPIEIREIIGKLNTSLTRDEEDAWTQLRALGPAVVPYLAEAYSQFNKWQGRASLVFHSVRYARTSEEAFQLGIAALKDKSTIVRYRACSLLAYSLRDDALAYLRAASGHSDQKTAEDATAAMDAIKNKNHHHFVDRRHSGNSFWVVNESDRKT